MYPAHSLLVSIAAKIDAVFQPLRKWDCRELVTILYEHRRDYLCGQGIPWHATGCDEAERKRHQRLLGDLEAAGLVTIIRSKAKMTAVSLTSKGDQMARKLTGVGDWEDGLCSLQEVDRRIDVEGFGTDGHRWLPETVLAGVKYGTPDAGKEFRLVELTGAAALAYGWLESNSDSHGRVSYAITELGEKVLESLPEPPACDVAEPCPKLNDLFWERFSAERTALEGLTPRDTSELGFIPLPCSTGAAN